jgi:hypothetical protein
VASAARPNQRNGAKTYPAVASAAQSPRRPVVDAACRDPRGDLATLARVQQ